MTDEGRRIGAGVDAYEGPERVAAPTQLLLLPRPPDTTFLTSPCRAWRTCVWWTSPPAAAAVCRSLRQAPRLGAPAPLACPLLRSGWRPSRLRAGSRASEAAGRPGRRRRQAAMDGCTVGSGDCVELCYAVCVCVLLKACAIVTGACVLMSDCDAPPGGLPLCKGCCGDNRAGRWLKERPMHSSARVQWRKLCSGVVAQAVQWRGGAMMSSAAAAAGNKPARNCVPVVFPPHFGLLPCCW